MKLRKISTLTTSAVLLLSVGLLSGCGDEPEETDNQTKEIAIDPVQSVEEAPIEPFASIDDGIESVSDMFDTLSDTVSDALDAGEEEISEATDAIEDTADAVMDATEESIMDIQELSTEVQSDVVEEVEEIAAIVEETVIETLVDDSTELVVATQEIIKGVQQALADAGFNPGPVDGFSGPRTTAALESFQAQNDLAVGQLDKGTLRALDVDF